MSPRLRFSLVVMTYERPVALRRCLDSIGRLAYPKAAYEVIVVDDGSGTRPTVPLEQVYPGLHLRYEWIPHQGVSAARNAGLSLASGDLVAFLADDYTLPPDYLSRAEDFFRAYPEAQVITFNVRSVGPSPACHIQQLYHELVLLQNAAARPDENGIIQTTRLPASRAAVFRREVFERVGPFDRRLASGEDGEMGQRLAAQGIPLYFMHRYYIDHHEEKGFRDFLRQRREYATSYFGLLATSQAGPAGPRWGLLPCSRVVLGRLRGWVGISRREGKLTRFVLLAPGLALFLFRFYLTLHQLERAASRARSTVTLGPKRESDGPSFAGDRSVLTALRRALNTAATRFGIVRGPTLSAIGALTRLSARLLGGVESVAAVYARGSYGRGDFRPFISDIDIAIVVRRPRGSGYDACRALHRRLRLVRGLNPFVRDAWQTIVTQSQWPLVARFGSLIGTDDWRLLEGEAPWTGAAAPLPERLRLAAWWNRQHFWTSTAVRQTLRGQTSLRELEGSLKKARSFARRISDRPTGALSLHGALAELDGSATRLTSQLMLDRPSIRPPAEHLDLATPTARERRALLQLEAELDLERDGITVVATEGFLVLITGRSWMAEEYRMGLEALALVYRATGMLTFLYSPNSFALAPLTRRLRLLRAGDSSIGAAVPAVPLLLREQLLYQSLYLGTHLWVAAGRADPGLERHVADALDACRFFLTGELSRDPLGVRQALALVEPLDQGLSHRLRRVPGLARALAAGTDLEPAELFEVGTTAAERLAEILAGLDLRSDQVRVAAVS